jgi:Domain of unknown function (DUF4387)
LAELRKIVDKVRSKNAGPFWLTIDIFCGSDAAFARVRDGLPSARLAAVFGADAASLKRFEIPALRVIKFSLPRPSVQGSPADRDMHGASWAALVGEITLT